jgi:hypothetical protein
MNTHDLMTCGFIAEVPDALEDRHLAFASPYLGEQP